MLDLRNLRYFTVLARRLNYLRAADELGITQPTLTRAIQTLERQLEVRLLDRDRGSVSLTPQGALIAERAIFLLTDAEDMERHSKHYGQGESGHIRFGIAPMPARALLPQVLSDRLNAAPAVTNEVIVRDVEALWGLLLAGEIEFFVSPDRPRHDLSAASLERLGIFPLSLIIRAGHPLLSNSHATERFPLIRSSWTGMTVPAEIEPHILGKPNVVEDFSTLMAITMSTNAIWMSSAYAIHEEIANGSLVEYLRGEEQVEVMLFSLKRRTRSPLAKAITSRLEHYVRVLAGS